MGCGAAACGMLLARRHPTLVPLLCLFSFSVQMAADPDYDLPASVGSRPALRGTPRPAPPTVQQLGQALEEQKEALMAQYGLVRPSWAVERFGALLRLGVGPARWLGMGACLMESWLRAP